MRPLRVLLLASDGLSTGHLTRALALGSALVRVGAGRGLRVELLVATTSEADDLLRAMEIPAVRLPSPGIARGAGWSDEARRALAEGVLLGVARGMRPDLLVADTFPAGPQLEALALLEAVPRRVLVRRSLRKDRALDPRSRTGLDLYPMVVCPDDPGPLEPDPACEARGLVRVSPITLLEPSSCFPRGEARRRLDLPQDGKLVLVSCGGGGDPGAAELGAGLARTLLAIEPSLIPVIALGPLSGKTPGVRGARTVRASPLQLDLAAFDMAISTAGYNSAHELAKARIPTALLARERMFDDQAARAERFARAGLAVVLEDPSTESLADALRALGDLRCPGLPPGGADDAASAIFEHMGAW